MRTLKLQNMVKGWFIGDFSPAALHTSSCEVAVKHYSAGDKEARHHHKVATEITVIADGEVVMGGRTFTRDDIIIVKPGEDTDFCAVTNATIVVVKVPSVPGDKYVGEVLDA